MSMYCYQCQETSKNNACTIAGVCGKTSETASLQDLLIWTVKGIAFWGVKGRNFKIDLTEADDFVIKALFTTVTNVNFDANRFVDWIEQAVQIRDDVRKRAQTACHGDSGEACTGTFPDIAEWHPKDYQIETLLAKAEMIGVISELETNEDIRSLRELLVYGLKGLAAYTEHAGVLDTFNEALPTFVMQALFATLDDKMDADKYVQLVLKCGEMGVQAMALLDQANTSHYGHPEPTQVNLGVRENPGILISGHDLRDLEELLLQTEGSGVDIYTHSEMLPANAYPAFKKYSHFAGNYGGSWWHQQEEFAKFNGPILMTTNCIVKPKESYQERIFTSGLVGWPEVKHIADRVNGATKDFSAIIELAKQCAAPQALEEGQLTIGFAHQAVLNVADQVVEAVQSGAIKKFVVMAGCDGRHKARSYYTDLAEQLPKDHVILTAGCAKYRYNKLELGEINGIPRVLDAGQCNDSYSLVVIAQKLAEVFEVKDINDLPIAYDIAWYEQKAVIVLLALLSLGVKNIRLGPTLPAFLSPNVVDVLVKNFNIMPIQSVAEDLQAITA
ncbi:MAG: hydroxylamine reductase [Anaerolineaceae bacterium]|nr:hydroxylamine reductase [Anaerolineaceae bacterium]